jgi:hypothetical protein
LPFLKLIGNEINFYRGHNLCFVFNKIGSTKDKSLDKGFVLELNQCRKEEETKNIKLEIYKTV